VADYFLAIKPSARKELEALDTNLYTRIERKIMTLANNPRPAGCKKLKAHADIWRIRVGDYRILYTIDDKDMIVRISRIAHRRDVYET
jgi:mRNA interferase RelE/StbE